MKLKRGETAEGEEKRSEKVQVLKASGGQVEVTFCGVGPTAEVVLDYLPFSRKCI